MNFLERLVEGSIRRRGVTVAVGLLVTVGAVATLPRLSIDAVPDVTNV